MSSRGKLRPARRRDVLAYAATQDAGLRARLERQGVRKVLENMEVEWGKARIQVERLQKRLRIWQWAVASAGTVLAVAALVLALSGCSKMEPEPDAAEFKRVFSCSCDRLCNGEVEHRAPEFPCLPAMGWGSVVAQEEEMYRECLAGLESCRESSGCTCSCVPFGRCQP